MTYTVTVKNTSEVDKVHLTAASFVDKVDKNAPADAGSVVAISPDCNGATTGDGFPVVLDAKGGRTTPSPARSPSRWRATAATR